MNNIIELDTDLLNDRSKSFWLNFDKSKLQYHNGVAVVEDYINLSNEELQEIKKLIPWVSGKIGLLHFKPKSSCPIHCDNHDGVKYHRSLNILVESDGNNHKTVYYKYKKDQGWGDVYKDALYRGPVEDLEVLFEFTVTKPTVFYNQTLHNVDNYGNKDRVMIMWLIDQSITDEIIFNWCKENNVSYRIVY